MDNRYELVRPARTPAALALLAVLWVFGIGSVVFLNASPFVIGFLLLFTLPGLWDAWNDRVSRLTIDDQKISWSNGTAEGAVPLDRIAKVRLHTGLDFSQRAQIELMSGRKVRIAADCLPGRRILDRELDQRHVPNERTLFAL